MLPINFHKTFTPERHLLSALVEYAALGKEGNFREISVATGIPMGESSGKVPAILDYGRGMGLIELVEPSARGAKKPILTTFGRTIYLEDRSLSEVLTQWLLHMKLCRNNMGAAAWNMVFAEGRNILGSVFKRQQLEEYLVSRFGPGNNRTGPLVMTYTEDSALGMADILIVNGDEITIKKAPIRDVYAKGYTAYVLSLLEQYFPGQGQVTFDDFNRDTQWFDICRWNSADIERVFESIEKTGYITVDRQMKPWIIERRAVSEEVWPLIFDDIA